MWGAISRKGAAPLAVFEGIMDSTFYQSVLAEHLVPFVNEVYPDGHRFQQDNDPKHVSRSTRGWMEANGVNHWPTPPESPDLNPIENMWHQLKTHLRRKVKPSTKEELVRGIKDFWETKVTPELCNRYINHLYKVLPVVVENVGAASGF